MEYFFNRAVLKTIKTYLSDKFLFAFFDYDGTLTPIVKSPDKAFISSAVRKSLKKLSKRKNTIVGIISGRKVSEVHNFIRLKNIIYIGNHGMEIKNKNLKKLIKINKKQIVNCINKIRQELKKSFKNIDGIFIENKYLSITVHYRNAKKISYHFVEQNIKNVVKTYKNKFFLRGGKKTIEVLPRVSLNKGTTLLKVIKYFSEKSCPQNICVVYIGDDKTDEDVFDKIKKIGISIYVKTSKYKKSNAKYYLKGTKEVEKFLDYINADALWKIQ